MKLRHSVVFIGFSLLASLASAQAYKCVSNGRTMYSDLPCASSAARVDSSSDAVSQRNEIERLRRSLNDKQQLQQIEGSKARSEQVHNESVARINAQEQRAAAQRATRCSQAQRQQQWAERDAALYRDVGWQNSLNQAQRERDAAASRARDACD